MKISEKGYYFSSKELLGSGAVTLAVALVSLVLSIVVSKMILDGQVDAGFLGNLMWGSDKMVVAVDKIIVVLLVVLIPMSLLCAAGCGWFVYCGVTSKHKSYELGEVRTVSYVPHAGGAHGRIAFCVEEFTCPKCGIQMKGAKPKFCPECGCNTGQERP